MDRNDTEKSYSVLANETENADTIKENSSETCVKTPVEKDQNNAATGTVCSEEPADCACVCDACVPMGEAIISDKVQATDHDPAKMVDIVGVRFKMAGKIYYFGPDGLALNVGDSVIVETVRGLEFGRVVIPLKKISESDLVSPLKDVIRKATQDDIKKHEENIKAEKEAFRICVVKIAQHNLPIKLIEVSYTFDVGKIIFYFTAEGRIDFRELVKDLASVFRTRIEMRQIGVRDEAKIIGGIGSCGRVLCCHSVLDDFQPVSIRMAKQQNLSLNPTKISGVCGRLMCCLKYESYDDNGAKKKSCPPDQKVIVDDDLVKVIVDDPMEESVEETLKKLNGDCDYKSKV